MSKFFLMLRNGRDAKWRVKEKHGETVEDVLRKTPDDVLSRYDEFMVVKVHCTFTKKELLNTGRGDNFIPE